MATTKSSRRAPGERTGGPKSSKRRDTPCWISGSPLAPEDIRTVGDYLDASIVYPALTRNTHHYVSDMLDFYGKDVVFEGIYGLDEQIDSLILFFHAHNTSLERRLLLLVGPQGAGKSYTVDKIKKHLDLYSQTDEGALFAVKD